MHLVSQAHIPYTVIMNSADNISKIAGGFPSPADDYMDLRLDLQQHLIKHPAATFYMRAAGDSMREAGILDGDLLIVDRSLTPKTGSIVIVPINGELVLKRLKIHHGQAFLCPANREQPAIAISDLQGFEFWGVVIYAIHDLRVS